MHVHENVRRKDIYFIHDSAKNPHEWWTELLLLKDLLLSASAESVNLILPICFTAEKTEKKMQFLDLLLHFPSRLLLNKGRYLVYC